MKRLLIVLLVCAVSFGLWLSLSEGQEPKKARDLLMQQKLANAQKVLEGVAVKDFDLIEKHADELILLSKKAEWRAFQTPEYIRHSDDFRRNCEQMTKTAKEKNLDGAALAYVQMTMSCVNCHKYVREVRMARLEPSERAVAVSSLTKP
jgi:hypothetical protein